MKADRKIRNDVFTQCWKKGWLLLLMIWLAPTIVSAEYKWDRVKDFVSQQPFQTSLEDANFGYALDVKGDYAVVGMPGRVNSFGTHGYAYVLKKVNGSWQKIATLRPPRDDSPNFGFDVAISDNLIAVSAVSEQNYRQSTVYLYEKSGGEWLSAEPTAILNGQKYYDHRSFGDRLDITDELVVIGSKYYSYGVGNENKGALYVYERPTTGWVDVHNPTAVLTGSQAGWLDQRATSVKISGDMIIATDAYPAALLVFEKSGSQWNSMTENQFIDLSGHLPTHYEIKLAVDANTIAVSGSANPHQNSGVVVILERDGNTFSFIQSLSPETLDIGFGKNIAIEGDQLVVLSTGKTYITDGSDRIYAYHRNAQGVWSEKSQISFENTEAYRYGAAHKRLKIENNELFFTLPQDDAASVNAGVLQRYAITGGQLGGVLQSIYPASTMSLDFSYLGQSVAISGDTAVIGAPGENAFRGAAYVLQKGSQGWQQVAKLVPTNLSQWEQFGFAVDIDGDTIVVGSPAYENQGTESRVFVYQKPVNGWQDMGPTYSIYHGVPISEFEVHNYGKSLSLSSNKLAVGAAYYNYDKSLVFAYELGSTSAVEIQRFEDVSNNFGSDMKWIDNGNTLVVAADANQINVYEYYGSRWVKSAVLVTIDIKARFSTIDANNNWIVGGSYSRFSTSGEIKTFAFKKPASGWTNDNETQTIIHSPRFSKDGASLALANDTLAIWADNELGIYQANGDEWVVNESFQKLYPYHGVFRDDANAFKYPVNSLAFDGSSILMGEFWESSPFGLYAGKAEIYERKLAATIVFDDLSRKLTDGLILLNAATNSTSDIEYKVVGGDTSAINLTGNLVEMLKPGVVQIEASVMSNSEFAGNEKIITFTVNKGLAVITNFNDMTTFKGLPPLTLTAETNSDGQIEYSPLVFIGADGTFGTGAEFVSGNQLIPSKAGTLYLRATVNETENYLADTETIMVMIIDI